ncbi:putative histidine kinase HHK19p, partial [Aureobasidium melanogenum]
MRTLSGRMIMWTAIFAILAAFASASPGLVSTPPDQACWTTNDNGETIYQALLVIDCLPDDTTCGIVEGEYIISLRPSYQKSAHLFYLLSHIPQSALRNTSIRCAQQIDSTSGEKVARRPTYPNMAQIQQPDMLSLLQTLETRDAKVDRDLRLLCNKDWSSTSMGPMSSWPQDLLTLIYVAMLSPQPQLFFLGSEQIFLYNTAYGSILRDHHPAYFAQPFATLDRLQPQAGALDQIVKDATEGNASARQMDKLVFLDNGGETEEVFLTGTMVKLPPHLPGYHSTLNDTTCSVVTRRRNEFLTILKGSCYPTNDLPALLGSALRSFSASELDFPFAAVYKVEDQSCQESVLDSPRHDEGNVSLCLAGSVGDFDSSLPEFLDLGTLDDTLAQRMREAITSKEPVNIKATDNGVLAEWCQASRNRGYGDKCKQAVIFPTSYSAFHGVKAVVVVGVAPRRPYDEAYQSWIREVQKCIADYAFTIACVESKEVERRKASDRAREEAEINLRESKLREREARLANSRMKSVLAMAETIEVGFFDYLPTGELIQANNAFYELSGYPKDPELNKQFTFLDLCMPEDAEMIMGKWNWLMQGKPITFDMRWKNNTPTGQWVQAACTPVFDDSGNIVSISGCTTNIMAQKLAQEHASKKAEALEQMRLSEARLLQFTENAPIGIVIRGSSNAPLYTNKSWFDITGHCNIPASDVDILSVFYPDDLAMVMEKRKEIIEQKKAVEFRTRLKKTWSSVDGSFQGQAWESLVEMRKLINTLENEKGDDSSSQKTKARLEEHLNGGTEAVDTIISCSMHQRKIADDILSLSKLDSNLLQVAPITVRATEMLNNVANIFAVQAERVGVKLQTQLDKSLSELNIDWVVADSGRISQVLVNLVTNSIKFTKTSKNERTVTVCLGASKERPTNLSVTNATTENPEARVQPKPITDATFYIWFSVTDTGCGMSEEEQKRMFNRFSQASPKTYTQYGGSGLGLFISKRLVELQGGQIGLSSQVDVGSKFAFYVPAKEDAQSTDKLRPDMAIRTKSKTLVPTAVNGASAVQRSSSYSVLVVEDNLVNQKVLQKHLTKLGHKVQVANHGQEALDYLATTSLWKQDSQDSTRILPDVDVVLMDIEMPVMDGLTCSKRIRELQASGDIVSHIPIIAVSANARTEQTKQAYDAGVDGFIVKPFRIPELISVITKLVDIEEHPKSLPV